MGAIGRTFCERVRRRVRVRAHRKLKLKRKVLCIARRVRVLCGRLRCDENARVSRGSACAGSLIVVFKRSRIRSRDEDTRTSGVYKPGECWTGGKAGREAQDTHNSSASSP